MCCAASHGRWPLHVIVALQSLVGDLDLDVVLESDDESDDEEVGSKTTSGLSAPSSPRSQRAAAGKSGSSSILPPAHDSPELVQLQKELLERRNECRFVAVLQSLGVGLHGSGEMKPAICGTCCTSFPLHYRSAAGFGYSTSGFWSGSCACSWQIRAALAWMTSTSQPRLGLLPAPVAQVSSTMSVVNVAEEVRDYQHCIC